MRLSPLKIVAIATFAAALLLAGCRRGVPTPALDYTPGAPQAAGQPPSGPSVGDAAQQPVALVNGQPITQAAFERELARFEAGQAALGFEVSDESGYRQQVLDLLIDEELIRQYAVAQGISVSDEQVDAEIKAMIEEYGEEYFNSWLQTNYYTLEEFREVVRRDLMTKPLLAAVVESVPTTAEHVHARHILVNTPGEAETILGQLQAGEDFAALAAQHSTDVTTRDRGGDLGWFPRGGLLVPEVEEVAFSQQPGQVSGVVSSAWGYHIVQTLEFDAEREIDVETRQRLIENAIAAWKEGLRAGASIQQLISPTS